MGRKRRKMAAATGANNGVSRAGLLDEIASTGGDVSIQGLMGPDGVILQDMEWIRVVAGVRAGLKGDVADYYELYRRMRRTDLKFKSLITTRKNGVLRCDARVTPNEVDADADRAQEVALFVRACLDECEDFRGDLRELLDAVPVGFAVSEIEWQMRTVSWRDAAGAVLSREAMVPVRLWQRRAGRFAFLPSGEIRYQATPGSYSAVPERKFVVLRHSPESEDPYGISEAGECFWWWFFKHQAVRWRCVWMEKFGQPTAVGTYPPGATDDQKIALRKAVREIQSEYGVIVPKNVEIKLLEAMRGGNADTYDAFIEYCDRCMSEALTGQSLATGQGTQGTGSYAQATVHADVKDEFVQADAIELMGAINAQLVRWIVDLNWGADVLAPKWVLDYQAEDLTADLAMDQALVGLGVPLGVAYFYDKYKRPRPAEDEEVVRRAAPVMPPTDPTNPTDPGDGEDEEDSSSTSANATADKTKEEKKNNKAATPRGQGAKGPREAFAALKASTRRKQVERIEGRCALAGAKALLGLRGRIEAKLGEASDLADAHSRLGMVADRGEEGLVDVMGAAKVAGALVAWAQVGAE